MGTVIQTWTLRGVRPGKPLTSNDRFNRWEQAALTRQWREASFWWAKRDRLNCRRAQGQVEVWVAFGTRQPGKKRDPHNFFPTVKAICDGLTDAAVWVDDDSTHVRTVEPTFTNTIPPDSVEVTLTWVEEE